MTKTKKSAVTSVTYGLLSALIITVIVGGLSRVGIGVEKVFSAAGNGITATAGNSTSTSTSVTSTPTPNPTPTLTAEQQSEIANAAAEIAAGTASAACLQSMSSAANVAIMASNNATCLGPGLNITPPQQPISMFATAATNSSPVYTYPGGQIYAAKASYNNNTTALNSPGIWFYGNGFVMNGTSWNNWEPCSPPSGYKWAYSPSTVTTTQGSSTSCTGGTSTGGSEFNSVNASQSAPLGYITADTW